jgi:predicted N-acyltransferase
MLLHLRARVRACAQRRTTTPPVTSTPPARAPRAADATRARPLARASASSASSSWPSPATTATTATSSSSAAYAAGAANADADAAGGADPHEDDDDDDASDFELVLQVAPSISAAPADEWDAVAVAAAGGPSRANPFVAHAFLQALEDSGSAQPRAGWAPQHLLVRLRRRRESGGAPPSGGALVGCAPVYLKGHSAGEYVFDHSWAEFHEARGGSYYPKVLCGVPFTPVEGPRLMAGGPALDPVARRLVMQRRQQQQRQGGGGGGGGGDYSLEDARRDARAAVRRALVSGLRELADEYGCSGAHVNFCTAEEQAALGEGLLLLPDDAQEERGGGSAQEQQRQRQEQQQQLAARAFLPRYGWQYHWENRGYASFADFEADLRQSRRKSVRQERKAVAKQGLALRRRRGDELSAREWDAFHDFYLDTVDRRWGRAYLTRDFFARLGGEPALARSVLMVTAHESVGGGGGSAAGGGASSPSASALATASASASTLVAGALNLQGGDAIFGRNWGAAPGRADSHPFLHFCLCYYEAIEHAIEAGLPRVEAGAQGEHKLQRGYLPALTRSAHYIRASDAPGAALKVAVARFLRGEAREVSGAWERLSLQASPFKEGTTAEVVARRAKEYLSAGGGVAVPLDLARAAAAAAAAASASASSSSSSSSSSVDA